MNLNFLFENILKPALGCTEPVSVGLASAAAAQASLGWKPGAAGTRLSRQCVRKVSVQVSRSIFKNSFAIAIPNASGHKGLPMAAALGLFCDPNKSLSLFENLNKETLHAAEQLVAEQRVTISIADSSSSGVYIRTKVDTEGGSGACVISGEHTRLASLWRNGELVFGSSAQDAADSELPQLRELRDMRFEELVGAVQTLPQEIEELLRKTITMNVAACKAALERPMGIGTGYYGSGVEAFGQVHQIASLTAAGSDARMSGYAVEIMSSGGSGNQGIMATIPLVVYAQTRFISEDELLKAMALSHLVTMYITLHVGYLSALCGVAIKAGIGAACGLTQLMGGGEEEISCAVKIMAATLTGMICDGAKAGCALKVSSATDMALRAATLAMRRAEVPDDNGIVAHTATETIHNLATLNRSMASVDQKILEIMLAKI